VNKNIPNQNILDAFSVSGTAIQLIGGEGECYRVGDVVLKPTRNSAEASWIADIYENLESDDFRIPQPVRAKNESWVYDGYTANKHLDGEIKKDNYLEAMELSKVFHNAIKDIEKVDFFDQKTDVFAIADRMAWGEMPIYDYEIANKAIEKLFALLKENQLPNQLIHVGLVLLLVELLRRCLLMLFESFN